MQQVDLPFGLWPWGLVSGDGVEAAAGSRPLFVQKPNHPRCDWSLSPPSLLRHQPSWVAAAASRRFPTSFLYAVLSPFSSLRNPELEIVMSLLCSKSPSSSLVLHKISSAPHDHQDTSGPGPWLVPSLPFYLSPFSDTETPATWLFSEHEALSHLRALTHAVPSGCCALPPHTVCTPPSPSLGSPTSQPGTALLHQPLPSPLHLQRL